MMTGTYWPQDAIAGLEEAFSWSIGDRTSSRNNAAYLEGPSYCVRLLVFDYNDCCLL